MGKLMEVPKAICQASYGNHFITSITVVAKSDNTIKTSARYRTGVDPYLERHLGHYSSTFLLEIAKQIVKAGVVLNFETHHPTNRFIVNEIRMDFNQYLVLDEAYELSIECEAELTFRKGKVRKGKTTTWFSQDQKSGVVVYMDWACTTPAVETRLEKAIGHKISTGVS